MADSAIEQKLARLGMGAAPRVLDLFSGCGGLSLGFHKAGFEITAAVESNPVAAASHARNFHAGDSRHAQALDITQVKPSQLASRLGLGRVTDAVDVIIGGPPCQAFARVGRSKLREIDDDPEAFRHDPRAKLFAPYLDYVRAFRPLALLMENVPDAMNFGGKNIPQEVCEILINQGYICAYTLLNAAFYGVPQMRERMFLIAFRREIANEIAFPAPVSWIDLPAGYTGSRNVALKLITAKRRTDEVCNYVDPPEADGLLPSAVTAHDAIGDLPEIRALDLLGCGVLKRGARRLDELLAYDPGRPVSAYVREMKEWSGFEAGAGISDHVIRYLPRDYKIFAGMKPGDQYPQARAYALALFEDGVAEAKRRGRNIRAGSAEYDDLRRKTVPPYDHTKFPNKWRKMWRDTPARTIMAHLGKDSYSHIHYDSDQARTISVREAARLQSFPDGFVFEGAMNQAFQQIGNAVPPLMAFALAKVMKNTLSDARSVRRANELVLGATG
ncbi:DNA cytosine methyltransferase [Jannaschia sp. S6380]|uniref:DNA cytosine methyltransferase n=1 Tax=Jannaschia sp. S6380 TaxID=2926408 RepID=UPI001FF0FBF4|nr:DNA cytosine methyltransferase [Jannaschia sp. S6380]MCK0166222.1 DNA cytosine methyltransferase [Jannaschia sp. S6380]